MSRSISSETLMQERQPWQVVDVRKAPARRVSGQALPGSVYRRPFDAENWWREFEGDKVVVYCVHGHEVSQAVCGFLRDQGIEARFLEEGFEGWRDRGLAVDAIPGEA